MQPRLSEEQAREILALAAILKENGRRAHSNAQLARDYGVHRDTVRLLVSGHNWKHLKSHQPATSADALFRDTFAPKSERRTNWLRKMITVIALMARDMEAFTSDDVLRHFGGADTDLRLVGPALKLAEVEGYCSPTDSYVKSVSKRSVVRVWRSNVFENPNRPHRGQRKRT